MLKILACCCALLALTPRTAAAEWHLTPFVGLTFKGNVSLIDLEHGAEKVHGHFGGAFTLLGGGLFGVEGVFVDTPGFFKSESDGLVTHSRNFALMGNAVLTAPRRWTEYGLRPFLSGGLGLQHLSVSDQADLLPASKSAAAFNIGGGAIGFLSQRVGLRFEMRYYANLHRTDEGPIALAPLHVRYFTGSVGIVFRFHAPSSPTG
jgi:hypothetical protein